MSGKGLRTVLIGFGQIAAGLQTDAHMARYILAECNFYLGIRGYPSLTLHYLT